MGLLLGWSPLCNTYVIQYRNKKKHPLTFLFVNQKISIFVENSIKRYFLRQKNKICKNLIISHVIHFLWKGEGREGEGEEELQNSDSVEIY